MLSLKNGMIIGLVIGIGVMLQVILILVSVGNDSNPADAAVDFTKAYYMLDGTTMSKLLCSKFVEDEEADIVEAYLNSVADRARSMGFSQNYMQNQLSHVSTEVQMIAEDKARVRITAKRLRSLNPVYAVIGKLFSLIEPHKVDETLIVIREDGRWKVCSKPFSLSKI